MKNFLCLIFLAWRKYLSLDFLSVEINRFSSDNVLVLPDQIKLV